ncbi:MFS transporter [Secundilactobacillus kimchicus]|uniref:Galactose cation symporter n=1 Tax=Secundilactobacillus kimchicus JCM 15530 TaxID=1302272 RepID=A0A0R1HX32_9LACO|nr:glycoside-pentoside-hexuronide (GPH):cation symporter [Secundilactobacillus kimchicus]KRK47946.1 galactose cation symporter [Secundilactobacillus kimchicus JCM 15530]MBT9671451.1 MFS transporter [Secundilactobacillus kimchicus]
MKNVKQYTSYALGAFGHDAFYATLSTYVMIFITSQVFDTADKAFNSRMIYLVSTMMVIIRIVEIAFDPLIGGAVDNTETRWGKFKPWLMIGAGISSVMLIILFTDFGGLTTSNPVLYLVLFGITYVILDIFYSFKDIAFWSMLPALSTDEGVRAKFGTIGRLGSTIGAQAVPIIIVPLVVWFSSLVGAKNGAENHTGWLGFAIVIGVVSFLGALATAAGTKENKSLIRSDTEKTSVIGIFKALGKNDQLMWLALSYFLFAMGYVVTNSLLLYYFTYVLGAAKQFTYAGWIMAVLGVISVSLFPVLVAKIHREAIYIGGIGMMIIGYLIFMFAGTDSTMVMIAIAVFFFPYPMIFLAALMTITDSVEYGQWKNGHRNESVTLAVRPLIDKLAGAFANGIVAFAAVQSGMIGSAKPSDISAHQLFIFKSFMFYAPIILIVLAAIVYFTKVKLTEDRHKQIVTELEQKLRAKQSSNKQ